MAVMEQIRMVKDGYLEPDMSKNITIFLVIEVIQIFIHQPMFIIIHILQCDIFSQAFLFHK